ncbi:A-kinase anchor protein 1, mitochondrial-like [Uloborus diversus]|uniref:A-kinase anchor protein 1, mitochondrial-like n=1 Tax=Uloborus diversus TaxID=327109 RepID=UPI0024099232|nr:A-kinase anchor protein 1, mitochondrial-like [Uloborus diversus]
MSNIAARNVLICIVPAVIVLFSVYWFRKKKKLKQDSFHVLDPQEEQDIILDSQSSILDSSAECSSDFANTLSDASTITSPENSIRTPCNSLPETKLKDAFIKSPSISSNNVHHFNHIYDSFAFSDDLNSSAGKKKDAAKQPNFFDETHKHENNADTISPNITANSQVKVDLIETSQTTEDQNLLKNSFDHLTFKGNDPVKNQVTVCCNDADGKKQCVDQSNHSSVLESCTEKNENKDHHTDTVIVDSNGFLSDSQESSPVARFLAEVESNSSVFDDNSFSGFSDDSENNILKAKDSPSSVLDENSIVSSTYGDLEKIDFNEDLSLLKNRLDDLLAVNNVSESDSNVKDVIEFISKETEEPSDSSQSVSSQNISSNSSLSVSALDNSGFPSNILQDCVTEKSDLLQTERNEPSQCSIDNVPVAGTVQIDQSNPVSVQLCENELLINSDSLNQQNVSDLSLQLNESDKSCVSNFDNNSNQSEKAGLIQSKENFISCDNISSDNSPSISNLNSENVVTSVVTETSVDNCTYSPKTDNSCTKRDSSCTINNSLCTEEPQILSMNIEKHMKSNFVSCNVQSEVPFSSSNFKAQDSHEPFLNQQKLEPSEGISLKLASNSPGPYVYEFDLPQELCGRLIGRQGKHVKSIKERTNSNVFIKRHPYDPQLKTVVVEGNKSDVLEALEIIRRKYPPSQFPGVTLVQTNLVNSHTGVPIPESLQLHLPEGASCDVILSSLVSAGHFFLQQPTHPTYPSLSTLDQCMINCYSQGDTPLLPHPVEAGVICAAPILRGWYRAQVICVYENGAECGIKFVDYGGFSQVSPASLRQIRSDFMTLPFQASECYLANVRPIDRSGWSAEATATFEELAQGQILQAVLVEYADDGVPCVHLYKVQGVSNMFINRELVDRGLAVWIDNHWDPH